MAILYPSADISQSVGSAEQEQERLAREADARDPACADRRRERTLRALVDVDLGRVVEDEAMQAWADSLGTNHELPVPNRADEGALDRRSAVRRGAAF